MKLELDNELSQTDHSKINVAVTYSPSVGGVSVLSIKKTMEDLGTNVIDADFRKIVPASDDLAEIFNNKDKLMQVFSEAKNKAQLFLEGQDCLLLAGAGTMVDPRLFGAKLSEDKKIDLARNIAEMALIHIAMQRGMPILAICAGHQILNVYLGGKVEALSEKELQEQNYMNYGEITIDNNSDLGKMINIKSTNDKDIVEKFFGAHFEVVTEQGGKGLLVGNTDFLKIAATAKDSTSSIEANEATHGVPVISLQFHPEIGVKGFIDKREWVPSEMYLKIYQADSDEEILKNERIFGAFKQSAETFKNKKEMLSELRSKRTAGIKPNIETVIKKSEVNPGKQSTLFDNFLKKIAISLRNTISNTLREDKIKQLKEKDSRNNTHPQSTVNLLNFFMNASGTLIKDFKSGTIANEPIYPNAALQNKNEIGTGLAVSLENMADNLHRLRFDQLGRKIGQIIEGANARMAEKSGQYHSAQLGNIFVKQDKNLVKNLAEWGFYETTKLILTIAGQEDILQKMAPVALITTGDEVEKLDKIYIASVAHEEMDLAWKDVYQNIENKVPEKGKTRPGAFEHRNKEAVQQYIRDFNKKDQGFSMIPVLALMTHYATHLGNLGRRGDELLFFDYGAAALYDNRREFDKPEIRGTLMDGIASTIGISKNYLNYYLPGIDLGKATARLNSMYLSFQNKDNLDFLKAGYQTIYEKLGTIVDEEGLIQFAQYIKVPQQKIDSGIKNNTLTRELADHLSAAFIGKVGYIPEYIENHAPPSQKVLTDLINEIRNINISVTDELGKKQFNSLSKITEFCLQSILNSIKINEIGKYTDTDLKGYLVASYRLAMLAIFSTLQHSSLVSENIMELYIKVGKRIKSSFGFLLSELKMEFSIDKELMIKEFSKEYFLKEDKLMTTLMASIFDDHASSSEDRDIHFEPSLSTASTDKSYRDSDESDLESEASLDDYSLEKSPSHFLSAGSNSPASPYFFGDNKLAHKSTSLSGKKSAADLEEDLSENEIHRRYPVSGVKKTPSSSL